MSNSSETDDEVIWKKPPPPSEQEEKDAQSSLDEFRARFNMGSSSVVQKSMSTANSTNKSSIQIAQSSSSAIKTQNQKLNTIMDESRVKKAVKKGRKDTRIRKFRTEGKSKDCKVPCGFPGCPWFYLKKNDRDNHHATHFKEKNVTCDECESKFKNGVSLRNHKNTVHLKAKDAVFKCPSSGCGRIFKIRGIFRRHLATHDDLTPYICRVCSKTFKNDINLNSHAWAVHRQLVPCKYCERLYTLQNVATHEARHERQHNYYCELCQLDFLTLEERFDHNQTEDHKSKLGYSELSPTPVTDREMMKDEIVIISCEEEDYPRYVKCKKSDCWTCKRAVNAKAVIINGHIYEINQTLTCTSQHALYLWTLKDSHTRTKIQKMMRYLGQTDNVVERMKAYKTKSRWEKSLGREVRKAFEKYYDDFQVVLLASTHGDSDALNNGEIAFIDVWDCTNNLSGGLNFLGGGKGAYKLWLDKICKK